jgi:hypothetical protein
MKEYKKSTVKEYSKKEKQSWVNHKK